jgi:Cytosine/adenosine deaminases
MESHKTNMRKALTYAEQAYKIKEVPVGAVIVNEENEVIGWGFNDRELTQDATRHAEINAIKMATENVGSWRLENTTMYVTLEPCPMCSGAIIQSRIPRVIFGAYDFKGGCAGSVMNILENEKFNHNPQVIGGILETECSQILKDFFAELRKGNNNISREIDDEVM